ncbi:hypothetical protein [Candidatus Thiodiazotropha endoloripes]|uniref:hypothetical protein n=1 Tax=Candidatus Thiodiazotropha endoloripes TaxID=1818881 RepID=UPI001390D00A|nr:hypothetical protein [Candidatus Thiodiazotropha endoloripes]
MPPSSYRELKEQHNQLDSWIVVISQNDDELIASEISDLHSENSQRNPLDLQTRIRVKRAYLSQAYEIG